MKYALAAFGGFAVGVLLAGEIMDRVELWIILYSIFG